MWRVIPIALVVGCYSPGYVDCEVMCAVSGTCPAGLMCISGHCVASASTTCSSNIDAAIEPPRREVALLPTTVNRDLDLLFLIDDSPSTLDLQNSLKAAFPALHGQLLTTVEGLPNVHIGVVTSDLGTKGALDTTAGPGIGSGPGSCSGSGKNGNLVTNGTTLINGAFIADTRNMDGTRTTNYSGTLDNAFNAIASVGSAGCGFEQHIEAAKRALNNNPVNAGFLRPNAGLAVIIFGDEDDCSMARSTLLGTDTVSLGPLQSFRCTRFGITCDQGGATSDEMNQVGPKSSCHSNEGSAYLMPIAGYPPFFKSLKSDPRTVMVAAIIGDIASVGVELRIPPGGGTAIPALVHACTFAGTTVPVQPDPGVRLAEFTAAFSRGIVLSACQADLVPAMTSIGRHLANFVGDTCIPRDIAMPADCVVYDARPGSEAKLVECSAAQPNDCYSLVPDPQRCRSGQQLRVEVRRTAAPPADTMVSVRCVL